MDVPRVPPVTPIDSGTAASGERPAGGGDLPFGPGQRLFARVVQLLGEGRALLDVGGERLTASTPLPLHEGDVLAVLVRGVGPIVELDIEAPPIAFSERAYAVAAVRQALQQARPAEPLIGAERELLVRALERDNWGGGVSGRTPRDRLLELLRPLPLGRDAAPLVEALRDRLAANGTLFEAHAARAERAGATQMPPEMQHDLRWLLAAIADETRADAVLDALRRRLVDEAGVRQLDTALARVRDGEARVDVPVAFGHAEAIATLRVRDDGPPPVTGGRAHGRTIALEVAHPELGTVAATAQWQPGGRGGDLQVRFAVADDRSAAVLAGAADDLAARLRAAGFRHVGVSVVVDPDVGTPSPGPPPEEPPPGGSILSALA